jgi:hypothetical protein
MSQEDSPSGNGEPEPPPKEKQGSDSTLPVPAVPQMEQRLEAALKDLPETKQEQLRTTFHEFFMAIVQRGAAPTLDAETARIITESVDKEHEYRYKFRTEQLKETAEESKRDDTFRTLQHNDRFKIIRPAAIAALIVIPVCLFIGIYLAATGHEALGSSILTGVTTSFLAFIAGLSTGNLIKDKNET